MARNRRVFWRLVVTGLALTAAITAGCGAADPPVRSGNVLTGGVETVDSLLLANRGRWVMINVWATWCRPCVAETPGLIAFADSMRSRPLTLIGLSTDYFTVDDTAAVRKVTEFQTKYGIPYENLVFIGSVDALTERLDLTGALPTTILFDPGGTAAEHIVGLVEKEELDSIMRRIGGV